MLVVSVRNRSRINNDVLLTSALTIGEILVKPIEMGRDDLALQYSDIISSSATIIPFDHNTAQYFATIRAKYHNKISPPDAIQLACAASYGTDTFITNDDRLSNFDISGIKRIIALSKVG